MTGANRLLIGLAWPLVVLLGWLRTRRRVVPLPWANSPEVAFLGVATHMLVALGAALFVLVPALDGLPLSDLSRVIQGVATGVGFLGAGVILKPDGLGRLASAVVGTVLVVAILAAVGYGGTRLSGRIREQP
ncbi:MAG: MgtC/SapB family protein [Planctomycetes bacterium]|nr:MgtC/SapB family protein [Planctomycetota bacterium]